MMASKKDFDPLDNLKPYEGESFVAPTTSLGMPQTGEQSSLKNLLENYGWMIPAVGIPVYAGSKAYNFLTKEGETKTGQADQEIPKKSIKDRFFGQPDKPIGPQTNIEKQLGDLDINTLPKDQRETVNVLIDAERKRMAKQQEAITAINDASQGKIPVPQNITPTISSGNPIQSIGVAPVSTPEVPTIAQLGQQATGTAPVAPPATTEQIATEAVEGKKKGRPTKEAAAKAMEGMTFRSDLGPGDNWLYNSFGAEGRKAILAKYNNGNPAGSYENSQQILAKMMQEKITPSRAELPRDIAKQRGVPPPETNYGKLGKAAKMGGIAGLALTAEQAAQAKDLSMLRQIIGESLLPLGATPSGVEPGTLGPEQIRAFQEAQKLGSPYRSLSR